MKTICVLSLHYVGQRNAKCDKRQLLSRVVRVSECTVQYIHFHTWPVVIWLFLIKMVTSNYCNSSVISEMGVWSLDLLITSCLKTRPRFKPLLFPTDWTAPLRRNVVLLQIHPSPGMPLFCCPQVGQKRGFSVTNQRARPHTELVSNKEVATQQPLRYI